MQTKPFRWIPFGICFLIFLTHAYFILKYAVDVPYWDEWEALAPTALGPALGFRWILEQHNEHRIVLTKLLNWLLYLTTHWDIAFSIFLNWIIYGGLLSFLYRLTRSKTDTIWFFPFLMSPLAIENFFWSFQSQFHFFLFFFFLSIGFLFRKAPTLTQLTLGSGCAVLSMFSFSAGVVCALAVLIGFTGFKVLQNPNLVRERAALVETGVVVLIIGMGFCVWTGLGYSKPAGHPEIFLPYRMAFISYFLNILSLGFGFHKISNFLGLLCLIAVLFPVVLVLKDKKTRTSPTVWAAITALLGVLATFASISMGRAGFGAAQAKSSRYTEIGMMLIPWIVLLWQSSNQFSSKVKKQILIGFWIFLFAAFSNKWNFKQYSQIAQERKQGLKCIQEYYLFHKNSLCPTLYPAPLAEHLDRAEELKIAFYRKLKENPESWQSSH